MEKKIRKEIKYYYKGNLKSEQVYLNGKGKVYYINGKLKMEKEYQNGNLWNVKEYDENNNIINELKVG